MMAAHRPSLLLQLQLLLLVTAAAAAAGAKERRQLGHRGRHRHRQPDDAGVVFDKTSTCVRQPRAARFGFGLTD